MAIVVKLEDIDSTFSEKYKELTFLTNITTRGAVVNALQDLKEATPVKTGRAKNSWVATLNPQEFRDNKEATANFGISTSMLSTPSFTNVETYYITNSVSYIDLLNEGSSQQAPARFIENTISKTFDIESITYVKLEK